MSDQDASVALTAEQQFLNDLWEEHIRDEFSTRDTVATLDTMVPDAYVNHVPVLTGGVGREQLHEFYSRHFIPRMPPDTQIVPVSRTIGSQRLVDEMIFRFTHTVEMDWMIPGVAPTGKMVECGLVVIVNFRDGKLASEHIYWDQASFPGAARSARPGEPACRRYRIRQKIGRQRLALEPIDRARPSEFDITLISKPLRTSDTLFI